MTGEFKAALEQFLQGSDKLASWDRHIPDTLCTKIQSRADFLEFLKFVRDNARTQYLEFEHRPVDEFLGRLASLFEREATLNYAKGMGIQTEYGLLAYLIILSLGESS